MANRQSSTQQSPTQTARSAGVLLHVTSLPSAYGIGDLGPGARAFIDQLARAKQTWWQILPLGPPGAGDSPYQCYSAFAGNPLLISPEELAREGLVARRELKEAKDGSRAGDRVDFEAVEERKWALIRSAREKLSAERALGRAFARFCEAEGEWLEDYALFMALRERFRDVDWQDWPRDLVRREAVALREARRALREAMDLHRFAQFLFFRQLDGLRAYAGDCGVRMLGDMPIFVSPDSADVWANPQLFLLDAKTRRPKVVAGVPPDYFSKTGQRWGNPLYDWKAMKAEGYRWWIARAQASLRQADLVRIDHFRGFAASWHVPASAKTAERGRWVKGPGMELFEALGKALGGLPFVAEDLGMITPDVHALREALQLPGMLVLHFAFGSGADNTFLPHHHVRNAIVYTGTHDNDTTVGWIKSLSRAARKQLRTFAPDVEDDPAWALMRLAHASVANTAIVPMQDVLALSRSARMNLPGSAKGNWRWRMEEGALREEHLNRLAEVTATFDRSRAE